MTRRARTPSPTADGPSPVAETRGAASTGVEDAGADVERTGREQPGPPSEAPRLPLLPRDRTFRGTVWIPRILWALEWGRREGRPPLSAASIARVLAEHGGLDVSGHNVARAFRDYRNDAEVARLWTSAGRGYEITNAGTRTLETLLADDGGA